MIYLQIAANGVVLGALYACIAVGFSLVWGVLNVINILHGTFIVLGSYIAYFAYIRLGIHPFVSIVIAGAALYVGFSGTAPPLRLSIGIEVDTPAGTPGPVAEGGVAIIVGLGALLGLIRWIGSRG